MVIDVAIVLAVVFHAAADTTGKIQGILIGFAAAHFKGKIVDDPSILWVLRREDVVEQRALGIVG